MAAFVPWWGVASADSSGGPVGLLRLGLGVMAAAPREFLSGRVVALRDSLRNEARFLNALDLGHTAVMDGDLHGTEPEMGDVLADDFQPVRSGGFGCPAFRCDRVHGWCW